MPFRREKKRFSLNVSPRDHGGEIDDSHVSIPVDIRRCWPFHIGSWHCSPRSHAPRPCRRRTRRCSRRCSCRWCTNRRNPRTTRRSIPCSRRDRLGIPAGPELRYLPERLDSPDCRWPRSSPWPRSNLWSPCFRGNQRCRRCPKIPERLVSLGNRHFQWNPDGLGHLERPAGPARQTHPASLVIPDFLEARCRLENRVAARKARTHSAQDRKRWSDCWWPRFSGNPRHHAGGVLAGKRQVSQTGIATGRRRRSLRCSRAVSNGYAAVNAIPHAIAPTSAIGIGAAADASTHKAVIRCEFAIPRWSIIADWTLKPLRALCPIIALRPLITCESLRALKSLRPLGALVPLISLRALVALVS